MRFAILGGDESVLQITAWAAESERHTVVAIYEAGEYEESLRQLYPNANSDDGWEALLLNREIDAVVVASQPSGSEQAERRADQLRRLVQESVPSLLVHPVCESILAFELEMIRTDTKCPLVAYVPAKSNAAFGAFCEAVRDADESIGNVEQIVANRWTGDRSRHNVIQLLAQDVVLIRELIGDAKTVSASGATGEENENIANISVAITGQSAASARWTIGPASEEPRFEISAVGERGTILLTLPDNSDEARLMINDELVSTPESSLCDAIDNAVDRLQKHIDGGAVSTDLAETFHALEVVDAVAQSCRRRRAIELLAEQPTEEDTFKAMMAAGGCAMLMWTLVLVLVGPLLFLTGSPILQTIWYILLVGPICVFLSLQLLRFVFDGKEKSETN